MVNRFFYCLLTVVLAIGNLTYSQAQDTSHTIGKVNIASPTAASLGKYGDIPVSYNTGVPNIGIPIYTIESGSLKLPVSMSYHASGLKVQENASWVGAGWSLNAGGVITRTVVGAPDDKGCHSYLGFSNVCTNGYYTDTGYVNYLYVGTGTNVQTCSATLKSDDPAFAVGFKDGEPDMYFVNFANQTCKFYFNDDQTPILVPESDLKIQPFYQSAPGFAGFIITTPDGTKYYFGKTGNNGSVDPVEISIPSTIQNGPSNANAAISSWYLNKIVSAEGTDSITLNYQAESYSYYTLSMSQVRSATYNPNSATDCGYNLVKNFVQGVRLTGISFANGSITFTPSSSPRSDLATGYATNNTLNDTASTNSYALGSISITNNNGFCKKDSFYYGYFYDNSSLNLNSSTYGTFNLHTDEYRLRLDSLQETTCDNSIKIPPYRFSYFSETVPRRLSFGMDHWGYYNGATSNTSLVPSYTIIKTGSGVSQISQVTGANRDASWPEMRGGTLQKIMYPTGGSTTFDFEANDTYCNYATYTKSSSGGPSVGYDGSTQTSGTFSTTSNSAIIYEFDLSNNLTSGSGNLQIFDPSNNMIANLTSNAGGGTTQSYFLLSGSTTYHYTFYKNSSNGSGYGLSSTIITWTPTTVSGNLTVGGLRIKTITSKDSTTAANMVTSYAYNYGGTQSSGILYSRPTYVQIIRNDIWGLVDGPFCSTGGCASCDGTGEHDYYISPASIVPMTTVQGNHIGYNEVRVSQTNNGYSIYRYYGSNVWDNNYSDVCNRILTQSSSCDNTIPNFPTPPQAYEPLRGELKYEGHYNDSGQVLKDIAYFPSFQTDSLTTPGLMEIEIPGMVSMTEYTLQSAKKLKDSTITTLYDPVHSTSLSTLTINYYNSRYHHMPTKQFSITSKGDTLTTNYKYAFDFRVASCETVPDSLGYYLATIQSDLSSLNSTVGTCTPQIADCSGCRWNTYQQYRRNVTLARIQFINYRRRSFSGSQNLLASCYASAEATADTLLKPILKLQDDFNNPLIEFSNFRNSNLLTANFTRYDTSLSPSGKIYPKKTLQIHLSSPSNTFTNAAVSGSTITVDSRYVTEASYLFSGGNPVSVTGHDGITNSYIWDYLNTQPIAKVGGASNDQIAYTSFEADGTGNWSGINSSYVQTGDAITGNKYYKQTSFSLSKSGLTSANYYVVSYWSANGSYSISGTQSGYPKTLNSITVGDTTWTLYQHLITGQSTISVTGSGAIDELRLYPKGALMTTYTYNPLIGITNQCDPSGRISYYSYDSFGRLQFVKDQNQNILKKYDYKYASQ